MIAVNLPESLYRTSAHSDATAAGEAPIVDLEEVEMDALEGNGTASQTKPGTTRPLPAGRATWDIGMARELKIGSAGVQINRD